MAGGRYADFCDSQLPPVSMSSGNLYQLLDVLEKSRESGSGDSEGAFDGGFKHQQQRKSRKRLPARSPAAGGSIPHRAPAAAAEVGRASSSSGLVGSDAGHDASDPTPGLRTRAGPRPLYITDPCLPTKRLIDR